MSTTAFQISTSVSIRCRNGPRQVSSFFAFIFFFFWSNTMTLFSFALTYLYRRLKQPRKKTRNKGVHTKESPHEVETTSEGDADFNRKALLPRDQGRSLLVFPFCRYVGVRRKVDKVAGTAERSRIIQVFVHILDFSETPATSAEAARRPTVREGEEEDRKRKIEKEEHEPLHAFVKKELSRGNGSFLVCQAGTMDSELFEVT